MSLVFLTIGLSILSHITSLAPGKLNHILRNLISKWISFSHYWIFIPEPHNVFFRPANICAWMNGRVLWIFHRRSNSANEGTQGSIKVRARNWRGFPSLDLQAGQAPINPALRCCSWGRSIIPIVFEAAIHQSWPWIKASPNQPAAKVLFFGGGQWTFQPSTILKCFWGCYIPTWLREKQTHSNCIVYCFW